MQTIIGFFTGPNLWAWGFIALCAAALAAVSIRQRNTSPFGHADGKPPVAKA
jgi:hypothetical protein